jgi:hypothetical protein
MLSLGDEQNTHNRPANQERHRHQKKNADVQAMREGVIRSPANAAGVRHGRQQSRRKPNHRDNPLDWPAYLQFSTSLP